MKFHVIIPARYASQRLPGKPLLDINGKPMIQRVVECARQSSAQSVVVATDDHRIAEVVEGFGAKVCMTKVEHESGTDRLQEVVSQLGLGNDEIVVNLQGDEPLMPAAVIEQVANNLAQNPAAGVATLSEPLYHQHEVMNPNIVKAVCDQNGMALYFSRAPIPWHRELYTQEALTAKTYAQDLAPGDGESQKNTAALPVLAQRHIGIYAYRVALLHDFVSWPMAALEAMEKLEQLRVLANGGKIHIQEACQQVPGGVDTQADLDRIRQFLAN